MQQKTGRFNYLGTPRLPNEQERYEYKQIIHQLTSNSEYLNSPGRNQKEGFDRKGYAISSVLNLKNAQPLKEEKDNSKIRSIILNEDLQPEKGRENREKEQETGHKESYRIIKESHIMNDEQIDDLQQNDSPTKNYYSPLKEQRATPPKYTHFPIKFYEVRRDPTPPPNYNKIIAKNNEPYINQALGNMPYERKSRINPENLPISPSRIANQTQSQLKRNNKAYRAQKSQEKFYPREREQYRELDPIGTAKKRSCYDYVPKELKQRLAKNRQQLF